MKNAVVLVGHGGSPSDFPKDKLARLKRLESERAARGQPEMGAEEKAIDDEIRSWPRTSKTDPYQAGLSSLALKLEKALGQKVAAAYNEFCGPDVETAVAALVREGFERIVLATTMYTRGGIHSENEIPALVRKLRERHPSVELVYAWPMEESLIVEFLAKVVASASTGSGARSA
ncbi:MAG: CbiX/SirB N-terminal domain-containing protein [Elusimicrobia bacterium]|nr:CbiX/SirB N-terminal domain-containing protein [Elusimicrobiota bacterium]